MFKTNVRLLMFIHLSGNLLKWNDLFSDRVNHPSLHLLTYKMGIEVWHRYRVVGIYDLMLVKTISTMLGTM